MTAHHISIPLPGPTRLHLTVSLESQSHFRCVNPDCLGWWTIEDEFAADRVDWWCPWCGTKQAVNL
jgi:hypothetical protein